MSKTSKILSNFKIEVHKANIQFIVELWADWKVYIGETLKADVEKKYPDGFKDFLIEKIEEEITKEKKTKE